MTEARPYLEAEQVEALTQNLMVEVKRHYQQRPCSRETVEEILNALAIAAAVVIYGTGSDDSRKDAREFFQLAFNNQLNMTMN